MSREREREREQPPPPPVEKTPTCWMLACRAVIIIAHAVRHRLRHDVVVLVVTYTTHLVRWPSSYALFPHGDTRCKGRYLPVRPYDGTCQQTACVQAVIILGHHAARKPQFSFSIYFHSTSVISTVVNSFFPCGSANTYFFFRRSSSD